MADRDQRTAWADVYQRHAAELSRLAAFLVGRSDAHDLVADAVARAVTSPLWSSVRDPGAYLARSVINEANSFRRGNERRTARELRAARLDRGRSIEPEPEPDPDFRAALDQLSPQQRAIVFLMYWADFRVADVAEWLGVTEGTVRQQLDRAKQRLREVYRHG